MINDLDAKRQAPPGKFRVISYDQFDYTEFVVGDFATQEEARTVAKARAAKPNAIPASGSDVFMVYDDQRQCLYRVTYGDETPV